MNLEDMKTDAKAADAKAVSWVSRHPQATLAIGFGIMIGTLLAWALF